METNENIINPQEEIIPSIDEGIGEVVGGSSEPVQGDNPFEDEEEPTLPELPEEPVQPVEPSQDVLSSLIKLALNGYELPDIIATYAVEAGWDAETVNASILTYGHDFGQFLMDEGLIDSEVEKKFLNYTMQYHIVDSLERLGKVDFDKDYEDFKDWIVTWAETKNYQSVLDALSTIGGKEIVIASTVDDINTASEDGTKALLAENVVFEPESVTGNKVYASSIVLNNATIISTEEKKNTIEFHAAEDVTIKGMSIEGKYPSTGTNYLIINKAIKEGKKTIPADETSGELTISGSSFSADAYNGISIGTVGYNYHTINIVDCDFSSVLTNNAINIYGCAEGGVINIKNCTFDGCISNPIRFFNTSNVHATINVENCVFKQWQLEYPRYTGVNEEYGYDYAYCCAGMIIFEDHKSGSHEAEMENKKFAKVTLNIKNCTGPFGKITAPKKLSDICCCMNKNQVICISYWETPVGVDDNGESVWYLGYAGFEDHFPTVNIA